VRARRGRCHNFVMVISRDLSHAFVTVFPGISYCLCGGKGRGKINSGYSGPWKAAPQEQARLLAALYLAQEQYGWLSPTAIQRVSDRLGLTPAKVRSTASFYSMFKLEPQGDYRIQVCEGLSCYLAGGAESTIDFISKLIGIKPGEITADGKFSLEVVQCIAACGTAPAMRINDELYEDLTPDGIRALIGKLQGEPA
jgi:NADH-quinone oxidoreductase subunit E